MKYAVILREVLEREIEVEAESFRKAKEIAHNKYKDEEIVLDYSDLKRFEVE